MMMKILKIPQRNDEDVLEYIFEGEIITVILNGEEDIFDFSTMPDGIATEIESTLSTNPVIEAERINGELRVQILNYIGASAEESEKFPTWEEM